MDPFEPPPTVEKALEKPAKYAKCIAEDYPEFPKKIQEVRDENF